MEKIQNFVERLDRIGIKVMLFGNYPWVYFDTICGKRVTEKLGSDHGFVVFLGVEAVNISETFKLIRKYLK